MRETQTQHLYSTKILMSKLILRKFKLQKVFFLFHNEASLKESLLRHFHFKIQHIPKVLF